MSEEKSLDLSQVSVANLLNNTGKKRKRRKTLTILLKFLRRLTLKRQRRKMQASLTF